MAGLLLLLLCIAYSGFVSGTSNAKPYIVYMGSSSSSSTSSSSSIANNATSVQEPDHLQLLLASFVSSEDDTRRVSLLNSYGHAFKGFSAMLTEAEATKLSGHDEVVSVFADPVMKLHTTRSWDFLEAESGIRPVKRSFLDRHVPDDVIVGVIDTGIWPESPSFDDDGIGEVPSRWKGVCMEGSDFKRFNCNRKLIGARYYDISDISSSPKSNHLGKTHPRNGSPRDYVGHGTHTSSTVAGSLVANASYYGLAGGVARGGSPSTRIASYKVCSLDGCRGSIILKAIDDAINDGVDIISISIGMDSNFQLDFLYDPISIGAFHAEQMGVLVVCSGGNDGPFAYTVVNSAPWVFTVAASSIDRDFKTSLFLGNGKKIQGSGIHISNLTRSKTFSIVSAVEAASDFTASSEASNCRPGTLNPNKVAGKIVVCTNTDPSVSRTIKKLVVEDLRAKGLVLINEAEEDVPFDSGIFAFSEVGKIEGSQVLKYMNSTKNPTATILPTSEIQRSRPAPVVASFSSRGPGFLTENILKPDIMAPGVGILAATAPNKEEQGDVPVGRKPSPFAIKSGTSMACPHVSGAAALVKSVHRKWSSSMIKSALMTTAIFSNNLNRPLTNSSIKIATPHETGVGEISPTRSLNPGLVFETTLKDYLHFLCYYGYSKKQIRLISKTNFNCSKNSSEDLISNMNYPSISVGNLSRHQGAKIVQRTVTNVGPPTSSYFSSVDAPTGLVVRVSPAKLAFTKDSTNASYEVSFHGKEASKGYNFGTIVWSDGEHFVRTVFAVNVQ